MQGPQITWLADGRRLHLHHGPIDMIVEASGPGTQAAYECAAARFETLLDELVVDLPRLRQPDGPDPMNTVGQKMANAIRPFQNHFVTPMAAVAGAGADAILQALCNGPGLQKAYVNNGGDVALRLTADEVMRAAVATNPPGQITIGHLDGVGGIATSGWRGRSHSFGIADSVTILAQNTAKADVAATMIGNFVDLPNHPAITRCPADQLSPDSDLGDRLVTTDVAKLNADDINLALDRGANFAQDCLSRNLINGAVIVLAGQYRVVGYLPLIQKEPEIAHA